MTAHDDWLARAATLGYRYVSDQRCPRRFAGKRHIDWDRLGAPCICESRLNDHAATWAWNGEQLLIWEPYSATGGEVAELTAAAGAIGLRVMLRGTSAWYPGSTVAIEFSRKKDR